jgi:hypothetical protein
MFRAGIPRVTLRSTLGFDVLSLQDLSVPCGHTQGVRCAPPWALMCRPYRTFMFRLSGLVDSNLCHGLFPNISFVVAHPVFFQ